MKYTIEDTTLTNIANSIRNKTNTTGTIVPESMAELIDGIEVGGGTEIAVDTCTLVVIITDDLGSTSTAAAGSIIYNIFDSDGIHGKYRIISEGATTYTLENVICNSCVTISANVNTESIENLESFGTTWTGQAYRITAGANGIATITASPVRSSGGAV